MSPEKQKIVDRIKHISQAGLIISFALVVVLQLIPDIWHIELPQVVNSVIKNTFITLFFLSFATLLVSSFWSTDDEKEERKNELKEAMQEARAEEIQKKRIIPSDERIKSPLKGLTPQQEQVIIDLLRKKILVVNGHLKTSELKHLLKALSLDGNLDDHDLDKVIAWVEQETGEIVDGRNLKYDYETKISDKEVTKWGNMIRERFELIEIY